MIIIEWQYAEICIWICHGTIHNDNIENDNDDNNVDENDSNDDKDNDSNNDIDNDDIQ